MADILERTIYKLEIDDADYIRGTERIVANTTRFSQAQEAANRRLQVNQVALKNVADGLARARIDLVNYTGTNERFRAQLERDVANFEKTHQRIQSLIEKDKQVIEQANRAAGQFVTTLGTIPQGTGALAQPAITPAQVRQQILPTAALPAPQVSAELQRLLDQIRNINPNDIANVFDLAAGEMEAFKIAIEEAEHALESMVGTEKEFSEEFKNLSLVVSEGKKIIEEFDKSTAEAARSSLGYRQQITLLHKELAVLDQANKQETQEYKNKQAELVRLKRAQQDQLQTVRILASETRALDFGRAAITTATSAFQAYTSVAILAGGASENLQKKTFQLFAAMQLITSIEQLSNNLKRVSVLRLNALTAATAAYNAVVGTATGLTRAFRIALGVTGIGAIITAITIFALRLRSLAAAQEEAKKNAQDLKEVNEQAAKSVGEQAARLIIFRDKLNDLNIPAKERIKIAKEYNETAEETNKIDVKQIDNLELINQKIAAQNKLILERAIALAATAKLGEAAAKFVDAQLELNRVAATTELPAEQLIIEQARLNSEEQKNNEELSKIRERRKNLDQLSQKERQDLVKNERQIIANLRSVTKERQDLFKGISIQDQVLLNQIITNRNKTRSELERQTELLSPLITTQGIVTPKTTPGTNVENVFEQERQRLLERLQQLRNEELRGIQKINADFALKLDQERKRIAKLLEDKKLTVPQAKVLIDLAAQVNSEELEKATEEFNKQILAKREKLNDDLRALQQRNTQETLSLLQDDFDRRRQLIDFNEQREIDAARDAAQRKIEELEEINRLTDRRVSIQEAEAERQQIIQASEETITNITVRAAQERQQLSIDIFRQSLERFDQVLRDSKLVNDKAALGEIQELVSSFRAGAISYEDYKKRLAAIQKKYEDIQLQKTIDTLEDEIRAIRRERDNAVTITGERYDELTKLIKQKEAELTAARTNQTLRGADEPRVKEVETINDYAQAIGQLTESVIQFWVQSNQAEQRALDRSIALQERRVEEARRIAERGNATYLKLEEDRLRELQIARENAARREIAINAAIQGSQLLVAVTGAIAKIAQPGPLGIAETIASMAIIVSSLAAGFALVRSLQDSQPTFATGTKYVRRTKEKPGVDTIPAWLTEGEAVIPAGKNKQYAPVVEAIHDGTVPASYLNKQIERYFSNKTVTNNVVKNTEKYHTIKDVPHINYERVRDAAQVHIGSDGKLAMIMNEQNRKIDETNDLQRNILRAMKNMSVSANIDKDGVSIMVNEFIEKMNIDKRV